MSSRILLSSAGLAAHSRLAAARALQLQIRTSPTLTRRIHSTSGLLAKKPSIKDRRGGYGNGVGMHLSVPITARNAEKAWGIWSTHIRQTDAPNQELINLAKLLAETASDTQTADVFEAHDLDQETIDRQQALAGYRVAMVLRRIFSDAVLAAGDDLASAGLDAATSRVVLGLDSSAGYEDIMYMLLCALRNQNSFSGYTAVAEGQNATDLAADIETTSIPNLAHLLLLAAVREKIDVTARMVELALETAIVCRDTVVGRDCLMLYNSDLAALLDPQVASSGKNAYTGHNMTDIPECVVEKLLELVAVGTSPSDPTSHRLPDECSQADIECNLDDISVYQQGLAQEGGVPPTSTPEHVLQWRVDTTERIYKAYVSAGMAEIPSPDRSPGSALQGSVVPSPSMLATMLGVFAAAGNIDQVIILYDTLVATLQHLPSREIPSEMAYSASYCYGIETIHKADVRLWCRVLEHICSTQQIWLAARVLEDIAADKWAPSSSMYEQYLRLLADPSEQTLAVAIVCIKNIAQSLAKPAAVIDPLVSALVHPCVHVSLDYMPARIEQALLLSGLPSLDTQNKVDSANSSSLVSDETARWIIHALISSNQISRARELAEVWSQERPELVNNQSISALILGLGNAGKHRQALELFANIQESSDTDVTVDILSSVLQVYMFAGDYEEAVSVSKRIRAAVRSDKQTLKLLGDGHTIYNYMIRAYCEVDQITEALRVVEEMRSLQLHATSETYQILVQTMSSIRSYDGLKLVVALANVDYNMVDVEADSKSAIRPLPLTTEYYNALIEAFGRVAEPAKALQVWEIMRQRGVRPNNLTATLLIDTCGWNERVHWDEDMLAEATFVYRDIPEDHVYTGMPLFHLHYLANTLEQLKQSGLKFSLANYCHVLEALIRAGFLETALDMMISRYETKQAYEMWTEKSRVLRKPPKRQTLSSFFSMFRSTTTEEDVDADADADIDAEHEAEKRVQVAKFMDEFSIDIPLCQRTVDTVFGMIAAVRGQCAQGSNVEPENMPFVQRASQNLLERLELQEQRLDEFLRRHHPELLPNSRQGM